MGDVYNAIIYIQIPFFNNAIHATFKYYTYFILKQDYFDFNP